MNKNQILQEMGIQVWVSREPELIDSKEIQVTASAQTNTQDESQAPAKVFEEAELSTSLVEMKWTILHDSAHFKAMNLSKQVNRVIEGLGVSPQYLQMDGNFQPTMIEGQVVIALGQKIGQMISGESETLENLRGILFDLQNQQGEEIPAIITYSLKDLLSSGKKKSSFWDDLLWARSIWFESRLY